MLGRSNYKVFIHTWDLGMSVSLSLDKEMAPTCVGLSATVVAFAAERRRKSDVRQTNSYHP